VDSKSPEKKEEVEKKEEEKKPEEKKPDPEPEFEIKNNPARVTGNQVRFLSFNIDERYTPIKEGEVFGIVMLKDNKPQEAENFITPAATGTNKQDDGPEPEAPEPFDYDPAKK